MREIFGAYQEGMKHAETHLHTVASDGLLTAEDVVELALRHPFEIHTVAVTDHNTISEAVKAKEYALQKGYLLEVVVGEEIDTKEGHLLALYIESPMPRGISAAETIRTIHRKGGLVVIPHPLLPGIVKSLKEKAIMDILEDHDPEIYIDGFEVFNFGVKSEVNQNAQKFFSIHGESLGAPIAGTDAHFHLFGGGVTAYKGNTLREGIEQKTTVALETESNDRRMLRRHALGFFGYDRVFNPQSKLHARWIERQRQRLSR